MIRNSEFSVKDILHDDSVVIYGIALRGTAVALPDIVTRINVLECLGSVQSYHRRIRSHDE